MAGYNRNSGGPSAEDKALERFADLMIKKIETISGDWKKPWFTERTAWPRNIYDGKHYDGLNGLMLSLHCEEQGYKIPVFGTFDRFLSFNYSTDGDGNRQQLLDDAGEPLPKVSVNKGEKSFPLYFTSFTVIDKETKEKIKWDDYKKLSAEEQKRYNVFPKTTVWPVFAVEQTNLREARPEMWQKLVEQNTPHQARHEGDMTSHPAIDRMIDDNLFFCPIRQVKGDNAYYSISKDEIVIPLREQFVDGEAFASNALHEMSHATGSEGRLARLKPAPFGSPEYAREELVAELSAAVVSNQYGLDKHIKEDSAAYLKSWLGSLKESPDFIRTTLTDVKKATSMVSRRIGAVQQVLDAEQGRDAAYKAFDDYSQEMSGKYGPEYYDRPEDLAKLLSPEEGAEFEKRRSAYADAEKRLSAARTGLDVVSSTEKQTEVREQAREPKPFQLESYEIHRFEGINPESQKAFYPYFEHMGIDLSTQFAFRRSFVLASRTTPSNSGIRNLSFPLTIPGKDDTVVGFEERGRMRRDGEKAYKDTVEGSNASEGLWMASPAGTKLENAGRVLLFESAYDAMAYYQLHRKDDKGLKDAVFVSTGGTPTVSQMKGLIRTAPSATFHLCFDNDDAGKQFTRNFESIAAQEKPYSQAAINFKNTPGNIEIDHEKEMAFDKLPEDVRKKYYAAFSLAEEYPTAYLCQEDREAMKKEIHEKFKDFNRAVDGCIINIQKETPSEGYKDWSDELLGEMEETTKKAVGSDIDGNGEVEPEDGVIDKYDMIGQTETAAPDKRDPWLDKYDYAAVGEYYGNEELRSLAHGIKDGDGTAIAKAAALMSPHLPQGSAIIPMPSHEGWPAGTLALCIDLARNRPDITVLPLLHGQPRTSLYDAKRDGVSLPEDSLKMTVTGKVPTDREVFIIDNVIATGETARAAIDAIPSAKVLVLADDVTKEKVWQHSISESRTATLEGNRPDDWRQRYDNVFAPYEGYAIVCKDSKRGLVDMAGLEVIPCQYDNVNHFSEGLAAVEKAGKWGYVDQSGNEVIPCQYDVADVFSENLGAVKKGNRRGFIDETGREVIPCQYDDVAAFSGGIAMVSKDGKIGFIDTAGKEVVPCQYTTAEYARQALEKLRHEPEAVKKETVPVSYTDNVVVRHRTEQNDIIGITDERTLNHVLEHDRLYKPYSDIYVDITPIASSIRNGVTSSGSYTAPSKESPDRVQIQPDSFMSGRYTLSVIENDSLKERQSNLTLLQAAEYSTNFAVTHNLLSAIDMPAEPETKSYVILADDNDVIMTPLAEAVRHYTENGKNCLISMFPEKPTHDIHISGNAGVYSLDFKLNNGDVRSYRDLSLGQLMTVTHDVVKNQRDMDMVNDRSRELNTRMMTVSETHPDQSASELSLFFRNLFALHNEAKKTNPQNMIIYRIGQSSIAFEADADRLSEKYGLTVIEDSGQTNAAGAAIRLTVFGSDSLDDYVSGLEKDGLAVDVNELHAGTDRDMSPSASEEEDIHHGHHR